ncbi:MAG: hypothetical protein M1829_006255 [Trizodia sp. TS-e1964]|nr:MAG: hypothetical protein M1829_006255 [Trizodia sp. TS-e1964]
MRIISGFRGWDQENARDSDEILEKPLAPRVPSANIRSKKSMRSFFFHPRSRSGHTSSSLSSSEFDSISRSVTSANCDDHTSAAYPNYPANTAHNYFPSTSAREDLFPTKTSFLENHNNTQNQAKKRGKGLVREMARRIQRSSDSRDSSNGSSVHTNLYTHSQPLPILYSRMSEDGCEALPANITVRTRKSSPYLTSLKQNSPIGAKFMATRVDLDINQTWNPDQAASPSNAERYPTYINMRQMSTSKDGPSQGQNKVTNRKHDISGVLRNARSTSDNRIAFSEHELFAQKQYEESYTRQGKENMILARSQSQRFAPSKKSQIPNLLRVESSKSRGWARLRSRSLLSKTPSSLTAPHPVAGLVNSKTATSSSNIPVSSPSKLNQIINLRVQGRSVVAARDDEIAKKSPKQVQQPYTPQKQTALESKLSFRFSPMAAGDNTFPKPSSIPKPVFGVSKARRRPDCTALSDAIISPTKLPPRVTHEELGDPNGAISTPKQLKPIKQIAYVSPRRSSSRPPSPTRAHELESNPCGIMSPDKSMLRNDSAPLSPVYVSPPTTVLRSKSSTVHTHVRFNVSSSGSPENKMPGPANSPPNADIFDMPRRSLSNSLDLRGDLVPVDGNLPTFANAGVNATLYAEIRRLQRLLEMRTEEASGAMKELRGLRQRMVGDRGRLLGEREREGGSREEKEERESKETVETRAWRNRAEWAEKRLLRGAGLEGGDEVDAKSASARRRGAVKR